MADTPQQDRDLKLPRTELSDGRFVTKYDPARALRICERVAEGETLVEICTKANGFPSRQTFYRWVVQYPELSRAYTAAREVSAHSLEEEALGMARELSAKRVPKDQIRAYDVAMNQLRWSAAKRNPRVYSDRASVQFTVPIQINTSLNLGGAGEEIAPDHTSIYKLEATMVEDHPEKEKENLLDPAAEMGKEVPPLEARKVRVARPRKLKLRRFERKGKEETADGEK